MSEDAVNLRDAALFVVLDTALQIPFGSFHVWLYVTCGIVGSYSALLLWLGWRRA